MVDIKNFTRPYTKKSDFVATISLMTTLAVYGGALVIGTTWWSSLWIAAPAIVILAFASVRLYVLQHDFGHHSLFTSKRLNEWSGYLTSIFSLTPFRVVQYNHNQHHAYLGNLDHRETTEVFTMTVAEWQEAPWHTRLWYRIYRNPVIMLSVGSIYTYFICVPLAPQYVECGGVGGYCAQSYGGCLDYACLVQPGLAWCHGSGSQRHHCRNDRRVPGLPAA